MITSEVVRLGTPGAVFADHWAAHFTFDPPLDSATLGRWVAATFEGESAARLWGNPINCGAAKWHVYGVDLATYTPVSMELTTRRWSFVCSQDAERVLAGIVARVLGTQEEATP